MGVRTSHAPARCLTTYTTTDVAPQAYYIFFWLI